MCGTHYFVLDSLILCLQEKQIDYTNLFSPYDFDKNDQITLSYFKDA